MATKTISITEAAYNRLANLKQPNESFSIVIERMTHKKDFDDLYGILSDKTGVKLKQSLEKQRKDHRKRHTIRNKQLQKKFEGL
jgi:predicted CopG family antitoxin